MLNLVLAQAFRHASLQRRNLGRSGPIIVSLDRSRIRTPIVIHIWNIIL